MRLDVYGLWSGRLLDEERPRAERRLEQWLLAHLWRAEIAADVVVSKRMLPTDIGCTPEETRQANRSLSERRRIERVDELPDLPPDQLALRLVLVGRNQSRVPVPFR